MRVYKTYVLQIYSTLYFFTRRLYVNRQQTPLASSLIEFHGCTTMAARKQKKNQHRAIRREYEPIGPTLLAMATNYNIGYVEVPLYIPVKGLHKNIVKAL